MKRNDYIKICCILVILIAVIFIMYQSKDSKDGKEEINQSVSEIREAEVQEQEEKNHQSEKGQNEEKDSAEIEKALAEEMKREKVELMDYVGLPVEEFIEKTKIPLSQADDNMWNTEKAENIWYPENAEVWLTTDRGKIVGLSVFLKSIGRGEENEDVFSEAFPYTVAGIEMGMPASYYKETLLKDAAMEYVSYNADDYTNLELSKWGIERLRLGEYMDVVDMVTVKIDQSLKEDTEGIEYIWEERVCQKEGDQNDRLKVAETPYTEFPDCYSKIENINKTFVWTRYPYLAIPGKPEMEKNANEVIAEAVRKMWDNTYGSTDENIIVDAEYNISYVTRKFISICFYADITDKRGQKHLWQYCNINMGENGRKAYLSDLGISKEQVAARCDAGHELGPVDTESFLKCYDTNWDQYYIELREYNIIVKPLYEEEENWQFGERTCSLGISR